MTKLSELQKAVANRNFEHDAIDEDLEFVEDQFDAFRKYFNAVYEDICAGETAKVFLSSGRWTTEQYQDTNFEKYLKRSLKNKGINTDNIKIQTGNTETEDTSDSGTSTMFNEFTAQKVDVTAATTSKSGNNFLILMFFGENKNHTYIKAVYNA